ncbi:MAG: ETC complex I subunit [Rhodobacteraceae bacterium]|nr:ETC complex I subunit [Paracoccaceae bacterium]
MHARIYQPARNAMQSGTAGSKNWVLEYVPDSPRKLDPLMGWTGSGDMMAQVRISFDSQEAAVDYAKANRIPFTVVMPNRRSHIKRPRGYGENFAYERREAWTH